MNQTPKSTGQVILAANILSVKHEKEHCFVYFGINKLCLRTIRANIEYSLVLILILTWE